MKSQPPAADGMTASPNRRRAILYGSAAVVSLIGVADSIYLTLEHISGRSVRCTIVQGCSTVLSSTYASYRGIPLALIGAVAYFTVFSLATLAAFDYKLATKLLVPLVAGMLLVTVWLVYLQAFVIRAFCQFCLLSAAITIALMIVVLLAWKKGIEA